ncbi:MAG: ribonuclease Z [Deltaproteobacteria bacterium]|nr:ribonuclease Z [Deltaproteobacteria bacterium]
MRPSFLPRLVNDPFGDPGLYIPFLYENRAILFDLGDIVRLSSRDLLKISHVFVTHTHMDHFVGFDRLLRLFLGREKTLYMYGPEGFLKNVEGKLAGYSWNLVAHYRNRFVLKVAEIQKSRMFLQQYRCRNGFCPEKDVQCRTFQEVLIEKPGFSVSAVILDHSIPCLGLKITEQFHVNIKKDAVYSLGLEIGPWLSDFKQALFKSRDWNSTFDIRVKSEAEILTVGQYRLGDLAEQIATITPGQKITYIADVVYNEPEAEKIIDFAKGSDHLYIEAAFLEKDRDIARDKYHLTAWQAGTIVGKSQVKQYSLFHFSPRYTNQAELLEKEAAEAYDTAVNKEAMI